MKQYYVEIVNYDTEEVVKRMGPMSERTAEKTDNGANINLEHGGVMKKKKISIECRDGKCYNSEGNVAVCISPGFGAGWTTWNGDKISPFEPAVVKMVLEGKRDDITDEWCFKNIEGLEEKSGGYVCVLGADGLEIEWLPPDTIFRIEEYDGSETITTTSDLTYKS